MVRKFFNRDKNYILEEVQLSSRDSLLAYLIDFVKIQYMLQHNPLGIVDDTVLRIQQYEKSNMSRFDDFYLNLMGIFRFLYYSDNQLEFNFDGGDTRIKYYTEWEAAFKQWTREFSADKTFIWGVLELTVFFPEQEEARFIGNRLNYFISEFFDLKIHPQKGIIRKSA